MGAVQSVSGNDFRRRSGGSGRFAPNRGCSVALPRCLERDAGAEIALARFGRERTVYKRMALPEAHFCIGNLIRKRLHARVDWLSYRDQRLGMPPAFPGSPKNARSSTMRKIILAVLAATVVSLVSLSPVPAAHAGPCRNGSPSC